MNYWILGSLIAFDILAACRWIYARGVYEGECRAEEELTGFYVPREGPGSREDDPLVSTCPTGVGMGRR